MYCVRLLLFLYFLFFLCRKGLISPYKKKIVRFKGTFSQRPPFFVEPVADVTKLSILVIKRCIGPHELACLGKATKKAKKRATEAISALFDTRVGKCQDRGTTARFRGLNEGLKELLSMPDS